MNPEAEIIKTVKLKSSVEQQKAQNIHTHSHVDILNLPVRADDFRTNGFPSRKKTKSLPHTASILKQIQVGF